MPDSLYHYTTAAGLLGILEPLTNTDDLGLAIETTSVRSFSLWATDARYLNDSAELTFAAKELGSAVIEQLDDLADDEPRKEILQHVAERIREGDFTTEDVTYTTHSQAAYVTCFCTDGDLLSQWRGYGANGGGYSIEFDSRALEYLLVPALRAGDAVVGHAIGSPLVQVNYGLDDEKLREAAKLIVEGEPDSALFNMLSSLAQFKHEAFAEEDEWRIVASRPTFYTPLRFRPGPTGGITPYIRLIRPQPVDDLTVIPSAIRSITVGPGSDQDLREEALRQLLGQRGFLDVEVKRSKTTYKG
ncbi:DUF2971 domain-containing protein [Nocardia sp. NPDC059239]|uniref:DUF2971 domain-containing protein n=1 Tax=unclassified Nocardia TaxID=2637762 RepID=UPI0036C7526D